MKSYTKNEENEKFSFERDLRELLIRNEILVTAYSKLFVLILVTVLLVHIIFAGLYLIYEPATSMPLVFQFVAFNITAVIVEVFLSRMVFMLASRAGQLRDLRCVSLIAAQETDASRLESIARTVTVLRRDSGSLKVMDVEEAATSFRKK
ncbi:hypothetical protein QWY84_05935 [Aquisalimonas lutea]|uniref:hypothetical protein n=1 Tax=Aquisalimonas lutea TaxID=1327750 RepID=UPI0025B51165|nr:hypothetical protein [Aquisalimonas lutea]MDN3517145.1 hypothetical protein [Aquisalimonas lutea]